MLTSTPEYVVGWASIIGADILIFILTVLKTWAAMRGPNLRGGNLSVLILRDGKGDLLKLFKFITHLRVRLREFEVDLRKYGCVLCCTSPSRRGCIYIDRTAPCTYTASSRPGTAVSCPSLRIPSKTQIEVQPEKVVDDRSIPYADSHPSPLQMSRT